MTQKGKASTNLDLALVVSGAVRLEAVQLQSAEFDSFHDPRQPSDQLDASIMWGSDYLRDDTSIIVKAIFKLVARPELEDGDDLPEGGRPTVAELRATYTLLYRAEDTSEFSEDSLEHFAALNGIYHAWPYWRELVHTVSGRGGLASIMVPVWRTPVEKLRADKG